MENNKIDFGLLILRISFGMLMLPNGFKKLINFDDYVSEFLNFMNLGSEISLILVIFAEIVCSVCIILGLKTRFALIPLVFTMMVAIFVVHSTDSFEVKLPALKFMIVFIALFITGPGKLSLDTYFSTKIKKV